MRQKKQVMLIALGIVLIFLISACGSGGEVISRDSPYIGGSDGIKIDFLKDAPPNEITDGNVDGRKIFPFSVVMSVVNEGEFPIERVEQIRVDLKGFLPEDFGVRKQDITNQMPEGVPTPRVKDSEGNIIEPVETFVTIPSSGELGLTRISANTEFLFRADVCYEYGTNVVSKICILENMISPPDDALCDPRGEKKVFSSSSPVKVTSFRQTVAGVDKIQFSFDIVHTGNGKVFRVVPPLTGSTGIPTQGCPSGLADRRTQENEVLVTVKTGLGTPGNVLGQNPSLECVGPFTNAEGASTGFVKIVNNKRTITCTQQISNSIDLERNVEIELRFNYLDSVDKRILAKHLISTGDAPPGLPPPTGIEPTKFRLAVRLFNDLDEDGERDIVLLNPDLNEQFLGVANLIELKPNCGIEQITADLITKGKNINGLGTIVNDLGSGFNLLQDIVFPLGCSEPLTMDVILNIPQGFKVVGKDVSPTTCKIGSVGPCSIFSQVLKGGFIELKVPVKLIAASGGAPISSQQIAILMNIFNDKDDDGSYEPNSNDATINENFIDNQVVRFLPPACQQNPQPTDEQIRIISTDVAGVGTPHQNVVFQIRYPTECTNTAGQTLESVNYIASMEFKGGNKVGKDINVLCRRCGDLCTITVGVDNPDTVGLSGAIKTIPPLPIIPSSKCP